MIQYTYHDEGVYNVTLYVIDDDGAVDSISKQINVTNILPTVTAVYTGNAVLEGELGIFYSEVNDSDSDLANLKYNWSNGQNNIIATHFMNDNGTVNLELFLLFLFLSHMNTPT